MFMVADDMIILKSSRSLEIRFKRPRIKSMFRLRSCASSTIMQLYFERSGSNLISCSSMPSVIILILVLLMVWSANLIL